MWMIFFNVGGLQGPELTAIVFLVSGDTGPKLSVPHHISLSVVVLRSTVPERTRES